MNDGKLPQVVMLSMWRDDAERDLLKRARHLLSKSYPALRWVWVVGDSSDKTEKRLRLIALLPECKGRVTVIRHDTGIQGDDPESRIRRLSETANAWLEQVQEDDDYCLIYESDLISPPDVIERLLAHAAADRCPVAGWPVLKLGTAYVFYDTYCYRRDGVQFSNRWPYHACYTPGQPFEVDSAGSCWLFHADDVRGPDGVRCESRAALDLCAGMKARGRRIWVDPTLVIFQPEALWSAQVPPEELL